MAPSAQNPRTAPQQQVPVCRTGTDLARRPLRQGEQPALRVVNSDEGREQPVRVQRPGRHDEAPASAADPLVEKHDQLVPLRTALVDGLRGELRVLRDRLREHLRQAADAVYLDGKMRRYLIDLVVASVLMSLGMVMLPPVFVSLPVKLLLFILVDGWGLITSALIEGVQ